MKNRITFRFLHRYLNLIIFTLIGILLYLTVYRIAFSKKIRVVNDYCDKISSDLNLNKYNNLKDQFENNEWEPLNEYFYVRAKGFYFKDKSIIRLNAISNANIDLNGYTCFLEAFEIRTNEYICLNAKLKYHKKIDLYSSYGIDCMIPIGLSLDSLKSVNVYVYHRYSQIITKRPIRVEITHQTQQGKIVLCSKLYNLTMNEYENIKYWFEFNKKIGYDKIVIYNNSIPGDKYNDLITSYNGYIEVFDYKYLPYLYMGKHNAENLQPYYHHLGEISNELRRIHEDIALNECYSMYRNQYKKIAVFDNDEIIVPFQVESNHLTNTFTLQETCNHSIHLNDYLEDLKLKKSIHYSYWFVYARLMSNEWTNMFMQQLEMVLNITNAAVGAFFDVEIDNPVTEHSTEKVVFQIRNHGDYFHAKNLLNSYKKILSIDKEFFYMKNLTRFHRILAVFLNYSFWRYGKSVHITHDITSIGHHALLDFNYTAIAQKYGYVSHFRTRFIYAGRHSIQSVFIDFNYYNCYLRNRK